MDNDNVLDVAIIGGGVSGVYAAWRLLTAGRKKKSVTVFEGDGHIGGRLLSVRPPRIPYMVAELGGMRILPAMQPRITELIRVLNKGALGNDDYIQTFPFPVDQPANISYLRGVHMRLSDFSDNPNKVPYHLTFQEFGKTAGELVLNAIEQLVPGITDENLTEDERREMAHAASFGGVPLYKQGFWQVLVRVMSAEAYQLAMAAGGYQTTLSSWNAADAIPWFLSDFGLAPVYRGFENGFQQVPLVLAERVRAAGGTIKCNARLTGFTWKDNVVEVQLLGGETVRAKALILAMPRRSLDLITPGCPLLQQPKVSRMIQSVTPRPLFKLFTTYEKPWWLPAGVKEGRSTTDMPVRQTYYWPKDNGEPAMEGRAMLMASYDDGLSVGFWDSFRAQRGQRWSEDVDGDGMPDAFEGTEAETGEEYPEWHEYKARPAMVAEVQRQLAIIHGLQYVPPVENASFKDWGDDPFGGGWNSWNIGVKSWEVKEDILKPDGKVPVYICGEAYSDAQGWVEGALQTADMVLEKYFRIKPL